jgi:predicted nucleic acid-binding Zn ribbon protein
MNDPTDKQMSYSNEQRRRYGDLRKRAERQRRRREQRVRRLLQEQREGRLHSLATRSEAVIEAIQGPAPGEDSSVPPDRPEGPDRP